MVSLIGKKMVVIGGSRGIGRRVVEAGIRNGAQVLAVARQEAPLQKVRILRLCRRILTFHDHRVRATNRAEPLSIVWTSVDPPGRRERRIVFDATPDAHSFAVKRDGVRPLPNYERFRRNEPQQALRN
jgi:NAD(P)-dependent dehydrogenase (short-subunit alcohol dehydrogenase family)